MDRRALTRQVLLWSATAVAIALLFAAGTALVVHWHGAHRLEEARAGFADRWGHLAAVETPAVVPQDRNGAPWLVAGGQAIVWTYDDQQLVGDLSGLSTSDWSERDFARAREVLEEQRHALGILLRCRNFDEFDFGIDGRPANYNDIHFLSLVKGLRLVTLEARLATAEGRFDDAMAALATVGRSSDGLLRTPVILTLTVGSAAQRWAASAAKDLLRDPCAPNEVIDRLEAVLPAESAVRRGNSTVARSVSEIADKGLDYIDDLHDPSLSWSIPFWVSNHYLFEDLFVAEILTRWGRYLELGQLPVASWPDDATLDIWGDPAWPPYLALAGRMTPSLGAVWVRAQAAQTELQQVATAIDLLRSSSGVLTPQSCRGVSIGRPTALTGGPVVCRYDESRHAIVIEVPGAVAALARHSAPDSDSARFDEIALPVATASQPHRGR